MISGWILEQCSLIFGFVSVDHPFLLKERIGVSVSVALLHHLQKQQLWHLNRSAQKGHISHKLTQGYLYQV